MFIKHIQPHLGVR